MKDGEKKEKSFGIYWEGDDTLNSKVPRVHCFFNYLCLVIFMGPHAAVQFDNHHCCFLSPSVKLEESDTKLKESSDKIEQLQSKLNSLFLLPKGPFRPLLSDRGGELLDEADVFMGHKERGK